MFCQVFADFLAIFHQVLSYTVKKARRPFFRSIRSKENEKRKIMSKLDNLIETIASIKNVVAYPKRVMLKLYGVSSEQPIGAIRPAFMWSMVRTTFKMAPLCGHPNPKSTRLLRPTSSKQ